MKEAFEDWNPQRVTIETVAHAIGIIQEYQAQGLKLTLRQLYYQFVSRDLIPNTQRSYQKLGKTIGKARMAGLIDWNAIEDRGREPDVPNHFSDLDELIETALGAYKLDRWSGQEHYCELWVEKAALAGVLEPMARRYHVTLMVNKGYSSLSAMYESAKRIVKERGGRWATVFYLGDHDPSGEDMVRDIQYRLNVFSGFSGIEVEKIALTREQIDRYGPPPNPTKLTDSRAKQYIKQHGRDSWEVDALEPRVLQKVVSSAIEGILDIALMDEVKRQEDEDRERLREALRKSS